MNHQPLPPKTIPLKRNREKRDDIQETNQQIPAHKQVTFAMS